MSQLLSRLEAQLAQETDPSTRAELTARISCLHSRVGRFSHALELIANLRREFGSGINPRASVWIMLAEGLRFYYERQYAQALDRITRAQFLAVNMGYSAFIGIASAWKALIEYHESRYEAMSASIELALVHVAPEDLDTLTRICLIFAIGFRFLGDRDQARLWFSRGHYYAVKNGDQAAIEALLHNSAIGAVDFLAIAYAGGQVYPEAVQRARFELESAKNLNSLTQAGSLHYNLHLQDARLKIIEGRYADAMASVGAAMADMQADNPQPSQRLALLQIQYCKHQMGDATALEQFFRALPSIQDSVLQLDERISVAWMARDLALAGNRPAEGSLHAAKLVQLLVEHRAEMDRLATALRQVTSHWTPDIPLHANDNIGDYY